MTETRPDLAKLLPDLWDGERRAARAPSPEEVLDYVDGKLSPDEAEAVLERLSLHPEATQLLLDLTDPSRLADGDDENLPVADPESLKRQLSEEKLLDSPGAFPRRERETRPVAPIRAGVHPFYRWAAAALLALSVGLGFQLARQSPPVSSAPDVALWELLPRGESGTRDAGEAVDALPGYSHDLLLYANDLVPDVVYHVRVVGANGDPALEKEIRTLVPGRVVLRLAQEDLEHGAYEIRLFADEEPFVPLAVYSLDWRLP